MRVSVWAATILLAAQTAWAVDPATHITQYAHSAWRNQDGFFTGSPTSIAQTTDGYLWIGTANGLFRFDGLRFVPWSDFAHQKELATAEVSALLGARDGGLWIGAGYHFYRLKDNTLLQFSARDQLDFVTSIIESRQGAIWLMRSRQADREGPLCEVQGQGLHCYGQGEGVPFVNGTALAEDATGSLLAAAESKLLRWQPASSTTWNLKSLGNTNEINGIDALAVDRRNFLWVGLDYPAPDSDSNAFETEF
jgi:ligand-binding sensor domain-containing protein